MVRMDVGEAVKGFVDVVYSKKLVYSGSEADQSWWDQSWSKVG